MLRNCLFSKHVEFFLSIFIPYFTTSNSFKLRDSLRIYVVMISNIIRLRIIFRQLDKSGNIQRTVLLKNSSLPEKKDLNITHCALFYFVFQTEQFIDALSESWEHWLKALKSSSNSIFTQCFQHHLQLKFSNYAYLCICVLAFPCV